jgi:predicted nucleic acid-binding protein
VSVIDASVLISALLPQDGQHAVSVGWLQQQTAAAARLIVPAILPAEIAGPIARRTGDTELALRAVRIVLTLPNLHIVIIDGQLGERAAMIAAEYRLRGADALYVAVAERLQQPLVTWDNQQRERASALIVAIEPTV